MKIQVIYPTVNVRTGIFSGVIEESCKLLYLAHYQSGSLRSFPNNDRAS